MTDQAAQSLSCEADISHHRRRFSEFIVRVADPFRLEKPHVVVAPDIGTSASLFAMAAHRR